MKRRNVGIYFAAALVAGCEHPSTSVPQPQPGSFVSGHAYLDRDRSGTRDPGEALVGVVVRFTGAGGGTHDAVTNSTGYYSVDIASGAYAASLPTAPDSVYFVGISAIQVAPNTAITLDIQAKWVRRVDDVALAGETRVIDPATAAGIRILSDSLTILVPSGPGTSEFRVGDIIVAGPTTANPGGLLRRIERQLPDVDGMRRYETTPAAIEDAVIDGAFSYVGGVAPPGTPMFVPSLPDARPMPMQRTPSGWQVSLDQVPIYDRDRDPRTTTDRVTIEGSFTITPQFVVVDTIRDGKSVVARIGFGGTITTIVDIDWGTISDTVFDPEVIIGKVTWPAMIVLAGPLPVVLVPTTELLWSNTGVFRTGITAGVQSSFTALAGIAFNDGIPSPWGDVSVSLEPRQIRVRAEGKFQSALRLRTVYLINGIAGPFVGIRSGLTFTADPFDNPWWEFDFDIHSDAGIAPNAFLRKFFKLPEVTVPVHQGLHWTIASAGGPLTNQPPTATINSPAHGTSITRGTAVRFQGNGSDPEDGTLSGPQLQWSSNRDGSLGNGSDIQRSDLSAGTHTITLAATDSKGATGTAQVQVTVMAPTMSGTITLTPSSCTIPAGEDRCSVNLTWGTTNPVATSTVTSEWPSTNYLVASGNSGASPVPIPRGSRNFHLYNSGQLLATGTATGTCVSGTIWNGTICQAPLALTIASLTPSGSVTLSAGQSQTYTITVRDNTGAAVGSATVNVIDPVGTANGPVSTNASGIASWTTTVPANRGAGSYTLQFSAGKTGYAGSSTVTRSVVVAAMSGTLTLTPSSCTIPAGGDRCSVNLTWGTTNPVATSAVTSEWPSTNYLVASGNSGASSVPIPRGSRNFYLYNSGQLLATGTATGTCVSGTSWNGSICQAPLTLTIASLTPSGSVTLRAGQSQTYTITVRDNTGAAVGTATVNVIDPVGTADGVVSTNASGIASWTTTVPANRGAGNYTLQFRAGKPGYAGSSTVTRSVVVTLPTGDLGATLKNVDNTNAPGAGTRFLLYTTPNRQLSQSNPATFRDVPAGTYLLEGYQSATFFGEEFWTSQQVEVGAYQTRAVTLTRTYPYGESFVVKNNSTGATISPGQIVPPGTPLRIEVTVRNRVPGTTLPVRVHLILDRSRSQSYDGEADQTLNISGGSTRVFVFSYTPSVSGQFYRAFEVVSTLPNGRTLRTDSWEWGQTFRIQ